MYYHTSVLAHQFPNNRPTEYLKFENVIHAKFLIKKNYLYLGKQKLLYWRIPWKSSFWSKRWWGTVSNTFWKSNINTSVWILLSKFLARSSTVIISCDSQECCDLNPCWNENNTLNFSRCDMIWRKRICSNSLQVTHVNETGLQFAGIPLSPFLKMAVMFAVSQSSGTSPVLRDFLKILAYR